MKRTCAFLGAWLLLVSGASAAEPERDVGDNAALRYWMAFAQMKNPALSDETAQLLERAAAGEAAWDDSLADIVQGNREALATMHRGTRLSFCEWGYEHDLLADAPIANVARARALGRLNLLLGRWLLHQGKTTEAVEAWLAGVRFSRDVASDGVFISLFIAGRSLTDHLLALGRAVADGKIDAAGLASIEREVAALPADGFDWSVAARHESETISGLTGQLQQAEDPLLELGTYFPFDGDDKARRAARARMLGLSEAELEDRDAVRAALGRARELNDALRPDLIAAFQAPWENDDDVFEALVRDEDDARPPALQKCVGGDRGAVEKIKGAAALQNLPYAVQDRLCGVVRCRRHLEGGDPALMEEYQVCERAAGVHCQQGR